MANYSRIGADQILTLEGNVLHSITNEIGKKAKLIKYGSGTLIIYGAIHDEVAIHIAGGNLKVDGSVKDTVKFFLEAQEITLSFTKEPSKALLDSIKSVYPFSIIIGPGEKQTFPGNTTADVAEKARLAAEKTEQQRIEEEHQRIALEAQEKAAREEEQRKEEERRRQAEEARLAKEAEERQRVAQEAREKAAKEEERRELERRRQVEEARQKAAKEEEKHREEERRRQAEEAQQKAAKEEERRREEDRLRKVEEERRAEARRAERLATPKAPQPQKDDTPAEINQLYNNLIALHNDYLKKTEAFSSKHSYFLKLRNILQQNPGLTKAQRINAFQEELKRCDKNMTEAHRSPLWLRYLLNVFSVLAVIPALIRANDSYQRYGTLQFWKPESVKVIEKCQAELSGVGL